MTTQTQYNYSIIGVDVAKDKLDIYFYDTDLSRTINNTPASIKKLGVVGIGADYLKYLVSNN